MTSAPRTAPGIVPMPPAKDVAADDRRRDHVQLVALADVERRAVEPGRRDRRGDRAEHAHEDVDLEDRPAGVDAGQLGRVGVAAVRVDVPPEATSGGEPGHHERDADQQDDRPGEAGRDRAARLRGSGCCSPARTVGQALRPEGVVGERSDTRGPPTQPTTPSSTSAHIGRSGNPYRRRCRRQLIRIATIARQPTTTERPGQGAPDRALGAAADELEVRVQPGHGGAAREVPDRAPDREQPAEGHDERRHADVGDDEALERPDERPRGPCR